MEPQTQQQTQQPATPMECTQNSSGFSNTVWMGGQKSLLDWVVDTDESHEFVQGFEAGYGQPVEETVTITKKEYEELLFFKRQYGELQAKLVSAATKPRRPPPAPVAHSTPTTPQTWTCAQYLDKISGAHLILKQACIEEANKIDARIVLDDKSDVISQRSVGVENVKRTLRVTILDLKEGEQLNSLIRKKIGNRIRGRRRVLLNKKKKSTNEIDSDVHFAVKDSSHKAPIPNLKSKKAPERLDPSSLKVGDHVATAYKDLEFGTIIGIVKNKITIQYFAVDLENGELKKKTSITTNDEGQAVICTVSVKDNFITDIESVIEIFEEINA